MEAANGRDLAAPLVSPHSSEPKLEMTPAVRMRCCEQAGERDDAAGASGAREDTTASCPTPEPPESSSEAISSSSDRQFEVAGLPTNEVDQADADSPAGEATERSSLREETTPETWDELCSITNYDTGWLLGDVGTPEDPMFTYEEAVRQRHCKQGLTLFVGDDIVPVEGDRLLEMLERNLKKLRKQVYVAELPLLPRGLLLGGWDGIRRPWALMDCPVERVPRIPSIRGCSRVTIAVLVSFPPEPSYCSVTATVGCYV